jgi:hypothetical protein
MGERAPSKSVVERRIARQADALSQTLDLYIETWGDIEGDGWFSALVIEMGALANNMEQPTPRARGDKR